MFNEKKYQEAFCAIHAPEHTLLKISEAIQKPEKRYDVKVWKAAVLFAAALLLPAGTALAYHYFRTVLNYYEGDSTLIEQAVQAVDETMQEEQYIIHVDSTLSDAHSTILGLTIEALTDAAARELNDPAFDIRNIVCFDFRNVDTAMISFGCVASTASDDERMRSFAVRLDGFGAPNTMKLGLVDQTDSGIILNLDKQIEGMTVTAKPAKQDADYFIKSCHLNATCVEYDVVFREPVKGDKIVEIYFRMADGTLKTLSQLAGNQAERNDKYIGDISCNTYRYRENFQTLVDPLSVAGVIMNGTEYSFLDDTCSSPAEIPDSMRPFLTPFLEANGAFYFYADEVCDRIGASMEKDGETYKISYLAQTIVCSVGDNRIMVNGEEQASLFAPDWEGQRLILPADYFRMLGIRYTMYYPELGKAAPPEYWLVTP